MRWPYPRTPALGRNLPPLFAEAKKVFDERVKSQFPIGMTEARLVEDLRSQGFRVGPEQCPPSFRMAMITRGLIVQTMWSVRWQVSEGRIEKIWGVYGFIAP